MSETPPPFTPPARARVAGLAHAWLSAPAGRGVLVVLPGLVGGRSGAALTRLAGVASPGAHAPAPAARAVLCVDALGLGDSEAPPEPDAYAWPEQTARLLELLDRLGLDRVDLAGWSLGGVWAQHLLRAAPQRVGAAVLAATSPELRARERAICRHFLRLCDSDLPGDALLEGLVPLLFSPDFLHRPGAQALFEAHLGAAPLARAGLRGQLSALLAHTPGPALPQVRRLLAGERDWLFPVREQRRLAAALGAPLEVFPDCGHALWIERTDDLVRATLAALAVTSPS